MSQSEGSQPDRDEALQATRIPGIEWSDAVAEQHLENLLTLAEEADQGLQGPEQGRWLARLEAEHANLRAALAWSLHTRREGGAAAALRLRGALHHFWWVRGYLDEGRQWCAAALELADASERSAERARVLNNTGVLARMQGDYAAAQDYHEQALAMRREIGDLPGIAASFNGLGNMACGQGDYAAARLYYEQSLNIKREIGNRKSVAGSLNNLGYVAYLQGDTPSARLYYEQSLTIWRELGNPQDIVLSLEGFAEVAVAEGEWERGARLWAVADLLREQIGAPLPAHDREVRDRDLAAIRQALGEEAFATAHAMGRALTLEQAIADALNLPPSPYAAEHFKR